MENDVEISDCSEESKFQELKKELYKTHSQKKRRLIVEKYRGNWTTLEMEQRYNLLVQKTNQKMSIVKKMLICGAIAYIPCWIICILLLPYVMNDSIWDSLWLLPVDFIMLLIALWAAFGIIVMLIMIIILLILRKSSKYYLNIKNI